MKKTYFILSALLVGGLMAACSSKAAEKAAEGTEAPATPEMDASAFVNITDVVPDVILEIRYFGTYNFVGARIDGYEQPTALPTASARSATTS